MYLLYVTLSVALAIEIFNMQLNTASSSPPPPITIPVSISYGSSRADFNSPAFQFVAFFSLRSSVLGYCLSAEAAVINMLMQSQQQ